MSGGPLDRGKRRHHALWLAILSVPLVTAPFMEADADRATLLDVEGPTCPSRLVTDVGCPGCGLTRGTVLVVHGRFADAAEVQPVAFLVVAFCVLGVVLRGDILLRDRMTSLHAALLITGHRVFALAVLAVWIRRFI